MTDLLDVDGLRARVILPTSSFDEMYTSDPLFIATQLAIGTSEIYGRLRKRYDIPFGDPPPEIARAWLAAIVTPNLYLRRGWDPESPESQMVIAAAELARAQMKEAADSKDGLWDLPVREDATGSGITQGTPLSYSESSAFAWIDVQRDYIRGGGT